VNEYSARYSVLDREFYIPDKDLLKLVKTQRKAEPVQERLFELPTAEHTAGQSANNMQGRDEVLGAEVAAAVLRDIGGISSRSFTVYEKLLGDDERPGIARELARMVLPLNTYTQWYWKVDLHNLLHFLRLRHDAHAQYEIRAYAEVLLDIVAKWVPLTAAAFQEYRVDGAQLSAVALAVIRRRLQGEAVTRETSGLGAGEWRALVEMLPALVAG
jgi:thymidylate synthase (FAD)